MFKKEATWKVEIEEIILIAIILLNIFDAIEQLPSILDYIKKIISWAAIGYIFYKSKPTKIIFGKRDKHIDFIMITGFFLMLIKDLVSYAFSEIKGASVVLRPLFEILTQNTAKIEIFGLYAGMFLLLVAAINMVLRYSIKKPSIMHIIHEEGPIPQTFKDLIPRLVSSYLIMIAFFLIVFNLVMEWLAIAIDAPLLIISLAIYIFFIVKHKEKFNTNSFLAKFGDFGSKFYEDVIEHFTYKKTILRALFAMLVLHIATETLHYIWPFIFGISDSLYFGVLKSVHPSAIQIFIQDSLNLSLLDSSLLIISLIGNIIAILFLLLAPGYLWFLIYKNKKFSLSKMNIGLLISSLIIFIFSPVFHFKPLINESIAGVDIIGQSIIQNSLIPFNIVILFALSTGLIFSIISHNLKTENLILKILTKICQLGFSIYILMFAYSVCVYYLRTIIYLSSSNIFLMLIFVVFFIITALFYILGIIGFIKDTNSHAKEHLKAT